MPIEQSAEANAPKCFSLSSGERAGVELLLAFLESVEVNLATAMPKEYHTIQHPFVSWQPPCSENRSRQSEY